METWVSEGKSVFKGRERGKYLAVGREVRLSLWQGITWLRLQAGARKCPCGLKYWSSGRAGAAEVRVVRIGIRGIKLHVISFEAKGMY